MAVAYDLPASTMTLTQNYLDKWGVTLYEALEVAKANLRETTKSYARIGSVYSMINGDSYDASRLVLTDLIERMEAPGDHIAMVPNRDSLLVAGSEDAEGLATMLKIAEEALQHERHISGAAFRLHAGGWEPWLPPPEHSLYGQFRELQLGWLCGEYARQMDVLEAKLEREGRDIFVASLSGVKKETSGEAFSYSVWSKDLPTLLPRSDYVVLVGPGNDGEIGQVAGGRWEDVERVAGYLMQEQEIYPERHLVDGFPTEDELGRIGKADFA